MLFSPRIRTGQLVQLCRHVGGQLHAGVDILRIWKREAERAMGTRRYMMQVIVDSIENGCTLHEAVNNTGDYFPKLFRQMVQLGEQTGHLDKIFLEIADQYEERIALRRSFLAGIAWPLIELSVAILIVGIVILVPAFLPNGLNGQPIDILGIGLIGVKGLATYAAFLFTVFFVLFAIYFLWSRGGLTFLQLDRLVMNIPWLGESIRTMCLANMAWALSLTIGAGMDIRRAMRLSLEATRTRYYEQFKEQVDRELINGEEIHDILRRTRSFPADFLDYVETGEISGRLTESMAKLAESYQEKSKAALRAISVIGGMLVTMLIFGIMILLIFKFAMFYIGILNEAIDNPLGDPRR
ncbi:Type II secretion system protein F [Bremerella volcania]|uniref:Type II secretion system protein F n=2 Tax=Bremerella volcania TaxID=2527984 RepID=A0A518CBB4_9BACT|nr:Type II secretion system protein F [Bremerella volcania]